MLPPECRIRSAAQHALFAPSFSPSVIHSFAQQCIHSLAYPVGSQEGASSSTDLGAIVTVWMATISTHSAAFIFAGYLLSYQCWNLFCKDNGCKTCHDFDHPVCTDSTQVCRSFSPQAVLISLQLAACVCSCSQDACASSVMAPANFDNCCIITFVHRTQTLTLLSRSLPVAYTE